MEYLSGMISYNQEERLINNIKAISDFPNDDKAQIKANNLGTLGRADGRAWAASWIATQTGLNTELSGTVEAIKNTFLSVSNKIGDDITRISSGETSLPSEVKHLKDNLSIELNMLAGLKNIQAVYNKRYINDDGKKDSINHLNTMATVYKHITKQHQAIYNDIVDRQTQTGEPLSQSLISPKANVDFSLEETMSRLDAYLGTRSSNVSPPEAREYISQGRDLLTKIMSGQITNPANAGMDEEKALTSLIWYLMNRALEKKQGHSEGSFAVEDVEQRLYNFLKQSKGCGDRESSHYMGRSPKWTGVSKFLMKSSWHQGIDVLNGKLPAEKRHILFGQVDPLAKNQNKVLFIKLESFSPFKTTGYGYDAAMHGVELGHAQYNKKFHPGSDDLPEMAKERVPSQVLDEFANIVETFGDMLHFVTEELAKQGLDYPDPMKAAKEYGIAYMTLFVQAANSLDVQPFDYDPHSFYAALPQLDHLDKRTGREVYLSQAELAKL